MKTTYHAPAGDKATYVPGPGDEVVYEASPIKPKSPATVRRKRMTRAEKSRLQRELYNIVWDQQPMSVRQCFYRASVKGLVDKSEAGYNKVQRQLVEMRRSGMMPYSWLADNSRPVYQIQSFENPQDAVEMTARFYRKALWTEQSAHVEIWLEKDALSGVIRPVTSEYDVGLYVARGFASLSFLHTSAEVIEATGKETYIYHLGDFDPSGVMAGEKIESTLRELAPEAEIHFERIAVTPTQIQILNLPTRPTKKSTHAVNWTGGDNVELDAIEPDLLRTLVREAIEQHLPKEELELLKTAEASEREILTAWAGGSA